MTPDSALPFQGVPRHWTISSDRANSFLKTISANGPSAPAQIILAAYLSAASLDHGDSSRLPTAIVMDAKGLVLAHVYGDRRLRVEFAADELVSRMSPACPPPSSRLSRSDLGSTAPIQMCAF
jgi:hypothetical protein